jgi:hypothetical protein
MSSAVVTRAAQIRIAHFKTDPGIYRMWKTI